MEKSKKELEIELGQEEDTIRAQNKNVVRESNVNQPMWVCNIQMHNHDVEEELPLSRGTVYNYMDIVVHFGVKPVGHEEEIEYSKLIPVLPLLRAQNDTIPKNELKKHFLKQAGLRSKREIIEEVREYKRKYGLEHERSIDIETVLHYVRINLPLHPSEHERQVLEDVIAVIQLSLGNGDHAS